MFACRKFQRKCVAIVFDMLSCWMFCDMSLLLCLCVMSCKVSINLTCTHVETYVIYITLLFPFKGGMVG